MLLQLHLLLFSSSSASSSSSLFPSSFPILASAAEAFPIRRLSRCLSLFLISRPPQSRLLPLCLSPLSGPVNIPPTISSLPCFFVATIYNPFRFIFLSLLKRIIPAGSNQLLLLIRDGGLTCSLPLYIYTSTDILPLHIYILSRLSPSIIFFFPLIFP